ncbi:MAG: hypothetical protein ACFFCQ_01665 [Promethearchaeota archaeon]
MPPRCPDCSGKMNWQSPFYACTICGLSLRRHELERAQDKLRDEIWDARYGEKEDEKSQRKKEYLDWYLKSKK